MAFTLFGFSIPICLVLQIATSENVDRPTRYITDPEFANFDDVKSTDQNSDGTLFGETEPFGTQDRGNYFMDVYSVQTGPKTLEFGHVFEDPDIWEQRYERKDHDKNRFQGQVCNTANMYQHVPKPDHYEFAYKRGNEHHFKQHHEKAAPHEGHFKIQTRWGDKHGGYGEHYWDYNHGGDAHEEGSSNEEIIDPSQTQTAKTLTSYSPPLIDARGPQISESHKSEHKERKKYYKPSKSSPKKKPEVTETPQITAKPELYQDIPKLKIKPTYEREYSPTEGKKPYQYQNVNIYPQSEHFPIMYDTPKKRQPNYDHVQSLKSYEQDNERYVNM